MSERHASGIGEAGAVTFTGEALRILGEGIATVPEIDRVVRSAGFQSGPFELLDTVGIDVNLAMQQAVYEQTFWAPRYRPQRLQAQLVAAGQLGQRTGHGFYRYEAGQRVVSATDDPYAEIAAAARRSTVVIAGQGAVADDLALQLNAQGHEVVTYSTEESPPLVSAGIPRARRLRDVLMTTTVAIEATLGPRELKRAYWYELDESLPPQIPILALACGHGATEIGSWSNHPERVIGFGYAGSFADASLIELSRGLRTADAALRKAVAFLKGFEKAVAVVGDPPGQVLTRLLSCLINEVAFALDEGGAASDEIDALLRSVLQCAAGPIAWSRRLGIERVVTTLEGLHTYYGEERYQVAPRLRRALWAGSALG